MSGEDPSLLCTGDGRRTKNEAGTEPKNSREATRSFDIQCHPGRSGVARERKKKAGKDRHHEVEKNDSYSGKMIRETGPSSATRPKTGDHPDRNFPPSRGENTHKYSKSDSNQAETSWRFGARFPRHAGALGAPGKASSEATQTGNEIEVQRRPEPRNVVIQDGLHHKTDHPGERSESNKPGQARLCRRGPGGFTVWQKGRMPIAIMPDKPPAWPSATIP